MSKTKRGVSSQSFIEKWDLSFHFLVIYIKFPEFTRKVQSEKEEVSKEYI